MKMVIATPFYPPERGVLGTYAKELQRAFEKAGHTVIVVSYGSVKHLPPLVRHCAYFLTVLRAARGSGFVLALDTWSVGMPSLFATKFSRVPLLVRIGGDFLWETYVERTREPVRLSEFYAAPRSFSLKERLIRRGIRMLTHRAVLLFNSRFQYDLWQSVYDFPLERARIVENYYPERTDVQETDGRVFVSAGRPIALKQTEKLPRAFARVQESFPKAELDSRLLPRVEHLARLAKCYAVIIPSVSEVSSNTAIDAVAAGKPFIMSDDTGTRERLGECGLFIDTRSDDALQAAIEKLLKPEEYEYHLARIREFSFVHSWDAIAREILEAI